MAKYLATCSECGHPFSTPTPTAKKCPTQGCSQGREEHVQVKEFKPKGRGTARRKAKHRKSGR